uniref:Uncharacterized protein n=1 Tax=Oryza sativa subsp. japonica TaxID=39947 RepID=Q67IS8_ORYSJ|nr:hypothetical protein [Oryza sativa Japonica Group]BAD38613.1 hypothetical protein [Oryza sativa Japonica Group]
MAATPKTTPLTNLNAADRATVGKGGSCGLPLMLLLPAGQRSFDPRCYTEVYGTGLPLALAFVGGDG